MQNFDTIRLKSRILQLRSRHNFVVLPKRPDPYFIQDKLRLHCSV